MSSRWRALILLLILMAVFSACGNTGSTAGRGLSQVGGAEGEIPEETEPAESADDVEMSDVVYLSMATSGNWADIARGQLWEEYSRHLLDWSGGRLRIRGYFNGSLGSDLELIEGVKEGTLCIINSVPSYQISVVPEAALLDVPGLFSSTQEYNYFIENYYIDTLQSFYRAKGIRLLASSAFDYRVLTSNVPVRTREELNGLKLRTMENKYHMAFWQALGASVVSMNFNQMRLAIQQNLLQAQENPLGYMISSSLSEVQNHVILTNHVLMISNFLMNEEQYESLSEENRELLDRFFREMDEKLVEEQPVENQELITRLRADGIEVYEASADIAKAITDEAQPVVLDLLRKDLGDAVVDDFLTKVNLAKAEFTAQ